jgi:hypothetical protein
MWAARTKEDRVKISNKRRKHHKFTTEGLQHLSITMKQTAKRIKQEGLKWGAGGWNKGIPSSKKHIRARRKGMMATIANGYNPGLNYNVKIKYIKSTKGKMASTESRTIMCHSSWEHMFVKLLDSSSIVKKFTREPVVIKYTYKGKEHIYYPDFKVVLTDDTIWIIEIKGYNTPETKYKYKAAIKYCKKHGYEWAVINEKPIKSLTDYIQ